MVVELVVAAVFLVIGARTALASLREAPVTERGRVRFLVALHDAAKAAFWLSLAAFFIAYGLLDEPQAFRWFVLIPIALAGIRLATATLLSR